MNIRRQSLLVHLHPWLDSGNLRNESSERRAFSKFICRAVVMAGMVTNAGILYGETPSEIVAFGASVLLNRQNGADPTWVDYLAMELGVPLANHAVGGSGVSGAFQQIDNYIARNTPSENTLFVIWPGPRPYLNESFPTADSWDYVSLEEKVGEMVGRLIDAGARNFFIPEMHWGFPPYTEQVHPGQRDIWIDVMTDYNNRQQARFDSITSEGRAEFVQPGWYELHQIAADSPQDLGFANGTTPGMNAQFPERHIYWDDRHQSTAFHRLLADDAYLAIVSDPNDVAVELSADGGLLSEDFDAAFGDNDQSLGQRLPPGLSVTGDQRLICGTAVTRRFRRGRFGRALGSGEVFNAGAIGGEDRALATSVSSSGLQSEIQMAVDFTGGSPAAARLQFDLEIWAAENRHDTEGQAGFDLEIIGMSSLDERVSLTMHRVNKNVLPPKDGRGGLVDGNSDAYRVSFDSGLIEIGDEIDIDRMQVHWKTIAEIGSEGWVFGLDNVVVQTFSQPQVPGDFDANGTLDIADIELLVLDIVHQTHAAWFDVTDDSQVNQEDLHAWIRDLRISWIGDANLDGEFGSADLILVFQTGQYEDGVPLNSGWTTGDWNGDGEFTSEDLILALADGGYEQGPRTAIVPEPSTGTLLIFLSASLATSALRAKRRRR